MVNLVYKLLQETAHPTVNDVSKEGKEGEEHIILTLDTPDGYRVVRLDVTDLGEDYLEHA